MKIHEITVTAKKNRKRVGRGIAAGQGKTAGRGTKGQNSRTGGGVRLGFEGGQNPLAKRLPKKRGFKMLNPTRYQIVNVDQLSVLGAKASIDDLHKAGLIRGLKLPVKLLAGKADSKVEKKLTLTVHAASDAAVAKIEAAGGSVQIVAFATPKAAQPAEAKE